MNSNTRNQVEIVSGPFAFKPTIQVDPEWLDELKADVKKYKAKSRVAEKEAESLRLDMARICASITGHCPRELCTTAEAVEWLVDRHKAATAANLKLDEIRTEKLAAKGLSAEASAVSAARVILRKSKRIADESADGKPDGQEENVRAMASADTQTPKENGQP